MISVKTLTLGQLETNCYLLIDERSGECLIVDPADSGDFISQTIIDNHVQPKAIILTHGHVDHVLGLLELKLNFGLPIYLHQADFFLLQRARQTAQHWFRIDPGPIPEADVALDEDNQFTLGSTQFTVLHTPGHTPGSVCLLSPELVITGDTIFAEGVGRTDFAYSDSGELEKSIDRLRNCGLNPLTPFYAGHGQASRLGFIPKKTLP